MGSGAASSSQGPPRASVVRAILDGELFVNRAAASAEVLKRISEGPEAVVTTATVQIARMMEKHLQLMLSLKQAAPEYASFCRDIVCSGIFSLFEYRCFGNS